MRRLRPPIDARPAEVAAGDDAPISLDEAKDLLARHRALYPQLWAPPRNRRKLRGVNAYAPEALPWVLQKAFMVHRGFYDDNPDFLAPRSVPDRWFAVKFFGPIHILPVSPGDKLRSSRYLSADLRARVGEPKRFWTSETSQLPADEALPPGRYFLKANHGSSMNAPVNWPPDRDERWRLERLAEQWLTTRFGLDWGEWWYALIRPRIFLEEDLSERLAGRPEIKFIVRDGDVRLWYGFVQREDGSYDTTYFSPEGARLDLVENDRKMLEMEPPEKIDLMAEVARDIGRRHRLARIDFLNARGEQPLLGEITICHRNGNSSYGDDDARVAEIIFGPPDRPARRWPFSRAAASWLG